MTATLTDTERKSLQTAINLSSAYAQREPVAAERLVLNDLQAIYDLSLRYNSVELEKAFLSSHLGLFGQNFHDYERSFVCYSASEAILIASYAFVANGKRIIAVPEPTYDGIPIIMQKNGLTTVAYDEKSLCDINAMRKLIDNVDILCMTLPNNPTGFTVSKSVLNEIGEYCAAREVSIMIDASFLPYNTESDFDLFELLTGLDVDWIIIGDTGKLWTLNGIKAGILTCSKKYKKEISVAFESIILSISPFTLAVLWQFANRAGSDAVSQIKSLIAHNRKIMWTTLPPRFIRMHPHSRLPIEVIGIDTTRGSELKCIQRLRTAGLGVVGSNAFYWNNSVHSPALRLSLARDPAVLTKGLEILCKVM
jgi:aspartate/methionine/tyrosine aminotransferase